MTPRGVRVRLAILGLGSILALGIVAPSALAAPPGARSGRPTTIYHKSRSFRIPFNIDPAERARIIEVQLWVSDDSGFTWKPKSKTTPDRPSFTFRARATRSTGSPSGRSTTRGVCIPARTSRSSRA